MTQNNPGNIRRSQSFAWAGEIRPSPYVSGFAKFESLVYGYRAMIKLLINYMNGGTNTIAEIITKFAPPGENPTQTYINFVSQKTGIGSNMVLTPSQLPAVVYNMADFEQSGNGAPGSYNDVMTAYNMLVNNIAPPAQSSNMEAGIGIVGIIALLGITSIHFKHG